MTDPQLAALRMLAMHSCGTTKHNGDGVIGGRSAACLERMGFARCTRNPDGNVAQVHITDAGRKALEEKTMTNKLERDPDDGQPKPKRWEVTFTVKRTVEVEADNAKDAETKARDNVLFDDEYPIDRDDIVETYVGWVNPELPADQGVVHLEGCWGNHCRHYDCEVGDCASNYDEYCSQCDIDAY